jgi:hypothetical protein
VAELGAAAQAAGLMDANIDPSLVLPIDFLPAAARNLAIK